MRIKAVKAWPLKIDSGTPYLGETPHEQEGYFRRPPYRALYSRRFETLLVQVEADNGLCGWGEALAPVGPEVPATIVQRLIGPMLIGRELSHVRALRDEIYDAMRERGHWSGFYQDAAAACDMALWDLWARSLGVPLAAVLGGMRETVPAYVSGLPAARPSERDAMAQSWLERGFSTLKLHLGNGVREDIQEIERLRSVLGDKVRLFVDAHWQYDRAQALTLVRELDRLRVEVLEAPLPPEQYSHYAEVRRQSRVAIALGEAERTVFAFRDVALAGAADILQPDIARTGITELLEIASLARAFGLGLMLHHSTGLGISMAAALQVAAALPQVAYLEYQPQSLTVANGLLVAPIVCERGVWRVPTGPGLGIELDVERLPTANQVE